MLRKTVVLHIGLPKTGSTSLQFNLGVNRRRLRHQGFDYFLGKFGNRLNHVELYLSCLRDGVETIGRRRWNIDQKDLYRETRSRVRVFIERSGVDCHVFSTEGLSFLRTTEELAQLKLLFPDDVGFKVIFIERDKAAWLASWKRQIEAVSGRCVSSDPMSALYVEQDTWLIEFGELKSVWANSFDDFLVLPYVKDGLMHSVCSAIGLQLPQELLTARYKDRQLRSPRVDLATLSGKIKDIGNRVDYWARYDRHSS